MKKFISVILVSMSFSVFANIDPEPADAAVPSKAEIAKSRSCFEEIERAGCQHPKENQREFRSCMSTHFNSLSSDCRKMMGTLYGKR